MLERRADDTGFRIAARGPLQRLLYERWVAPRFLSRTADTFRADIAGGMAGYLVLLYDHPSVALVDVIALDGFKEVGVEQQLIAHAEKTARQRQYPYLRAGLMPNDQRITAIFAGCGFQPLQFRRWEFSGTLAARPAPEGITMRPLVGRVAAERRAYYLQAELDAAQPAARDLIEAHYSPTRRTLAQAFELVHEDDPFGYLSARREQGAYVLGLSTLPEWWGHETEIAIIAAFPASAARTAQAEVRLRLDSTPHADADAGALAALGLQRALANPDMWFKRVEGVEQDSDHHS
jgi:hypothetical protein